MMKNLYKALVFSVILLTECVSVSAQQTEYYRGSYVQYRDGLELLNKQQYAAASAQFKEYLKDGCDGCLEEHIANANYYIAVCALELYQDDAGDLLKQFIIDFPESPRVNYARFQTGRFYYRKKDWQDAIVHFQSADASDLPAEELAEYHFKLGYSLFQEERYDEAYGHFEAAKEMDSEYHAPAKYYYAHIAYQKAYYQVALENFSALKGDKRFAAIVPYYISQIYFLQAKYNDLITYASPLLDTLKMEKSAEVSRMVGEAYYKQGKFKEAIPYLENYQKSATPSREDRYQLGYAFYRNRQYPEAISQLNRVTYDKDSLGQVAYYHLGDAYLQTDQKTQARSAYRETGEMDFNAEIAKDALFRYAVLAYELSYNPFDEAITAFEKYINKYPDSDRTDEAYTYLLKVYMTTKNYEAAMNSIEKVAHKDLLVKRAYQMIAYNRAVELFLTKKFSECRDMFDKVKRYPIDLKYNAMAKYWIAESFYQQAVSGQKIDSDLLNKSISRYAEFQKEPGAYSQEVYVLSNYNTAYAYMKLGKYKDAADFFRKFVEDIELKNRYKGYLNDAYLRTGDAFFMLTDNSAAIDYYSKAAALKQADEDYAIFQKSMALGYQQKFDDKIAGLKSIISGTPKSGYVPSAIFEIGETYRIQNKNTDALKYFNDLITHHPQNILVRKAMLNSALVYYKEKKYPDSERLYLKVLGEYNNPEDCRMAIDGLRDVYTAMNRIEEWEKVLAQSSCSGYTEGDLDSTFFNAGKTLFYEGDCKQAIERFDKYLSRFPKGVFITDAWYFKAECFYEDLKREDALKAFEKVIEQPVGKFTETSLVRAAELSYQLGNYPGAKMHYQKLEKIASYQSNVLLARIGLMRSLYKTNQYKEAADYADMVVSEAGTDENLKTEARFVKARWWKESGDYDKAITEFRFVNKNLKTEMGAEAKYQLAHCLYLKQAYKASESEIFEMAQQKPTYDYWLAKAYILLADNYTMLEDYFQAKETLKSVIDFYTGKEEVAIKAEAQQKLDAIIELENSSSGNRSMTDPGMIIDNTNENEEELNPGNPEIENPEEKKEEQP